MKKIMILTALLATTACGGVDTSKEGLTNQATAIADKARAGAEGLLAQLRGETNTKMTEQALAETGETKIEAPTAATGTTEAPTAEAPTAEAPTADAPAAEAPIAEEPTVEEKVAEARRAVTDLLSTGKYLWRDSVGNASVITLNADGSGFEDLGYGRRIDVQFRKVGEHMCFELVQSGTIGSCYLIKGPDANGGYEAKGGFGASDFTVTPAK